MQFNDPWEYMKLELIENDKEIYFFNSNIYIVYVLVGEVTLQIENGFLSLKKDDFFILSQGFPYSISCLTKSTKCFVITLDYSPLIDSSQQNVSYYFSGNSVIEPHLTDRKVVKKLNKLVELLIFKEKTSAALLFEQYFSLVNLLESTYQRKIILDSNQNLKIKIENLKSFIDSNFDTDVKLSDFSKQLYISENYLSRLFTKSVGVPFSEYLLQKRLDKVAQYLSETDMSITDVAFSSGFSSINSFNRIFRKYKKMTPSEYRSRAKKESSEKKQDAISKDNFEDLKDLFLLDKKSETINIKKTTSLKIREDNFDNLLINLGYAEDIILSPFSKQLEKVGRNNIFKYGRVWGILSDRVIPEVENEFDFSKSDMIIDSILEAGMIPFIELGFKGKVIHKSLEDIVIKEEFIFKSRKIENVLNKYEKFLRHCISKYGSSQVCNWKFELWKPNKVVVDYTEILELVSIEDGDKLRNISEDEHYAWFFKKIYQCLKSIISEIQIGGCGLGLDLEKENLKSFLMEWKRSKCLPDFFSITLYHMDEIKSTLYTGKRSNPISPDIDYMRNIVMDFSAMLTELNIQKPIVISEFNVTMINRHIINDTAFKGPYIAKNILDVHDIVDIIGYWQLSDLAVSSYDTNDMEIFGGAGILSKHGLPKSGYYAFEFLRKLGKSVIYEDNECILTKTDSAIQGLFFLYSHLNATYYYNNEGEFHKNNAYSMFNSNEEKVVKIIIDDMINGNYLISKQRIGRDSGNLLEEINAISSVEIYDKYDIDYLERKCIPVRENDLVIVDNNSLEMNLNLHSNELISLQINLIT